MLELRPNCECCDSDLPPAASAFICTFECTFCPDCAARLGHICPNCAGNLVTRPLRPVEKLDRYPASTKRTVHSQPCFTRPGPN